VRDTAGDDTAHLERVMSGVAESRLVTPADAPHVETKLGQLASAQP
jgi:hypothetical protein